MEAAQADYDKTSSVAMESENLGGGEPGLEELPHDLIKSVLSYLFLDDLDVLCLVSKKIGSTVGGADHLFMSESFRGASTGTNQEVHLSEAGMRRLMERFPCLNVLRLYGLAGVGDNLFSIMNESSSASTLHRIALHGCCLSYWCPTTLMLENLTHVTIMGGAIRAAFGSFFTSALSLRELAIGQCSSLRDEHVADISLQLKGTLESMTLHQCLRVRKPVLQFDNLVGLNLMGCFSLEDLPYFHCPSLRDLNLSFCFRIDGELIQNIIDSLPRLQNLALVKCPRLRKLHILSDTLYSLNVSLSNNLQTLSLSCCGLEVLEATSCSSLKSFQLDSKCIQELNLSMLPLQNAQVAAPQLTHLKLCGCDCLVDATIVCPNIQFVDICGTPIQPERFRGKVKFLKHGCSHSRSFLSPSSRR
jgi:hypothetical protein